MNNPNMNISQLINNLALRAADTLQPEHKIREVALQEGRESGMSGVLEMLISQLVNTGQQDINPQINEQSPIGLLADNDVAPTQDYSNEPMPMEGYIDSPGPDYPSDYIVQQKELERAQQEENIRRLQSEGVSFDG